jgi:hypothetical protein
MIFLAGAPDDTDEFDDPVILHELGHFIVRELSWDESPGGSHDGRRTNPLVAFGEGIATAFALLVASEPLYVDTGGSGVLAYEDLEDMPYLDAYGTSDGSLAGDVSEWATAALVWDLTDADRPAEPFDRISVSRDALLRLFFYDVPDRRRPDLGHGGMELADWLNAFRCRYPELAPRLARLLRHQEFPLELGKSKCEWSPY